MVFISKDVLPTFKRGEDVGSEQLMHMMDVFLKGCNELCARVDSIRNVSVHPESSIQSYPVIDRVNKNSDDILQLKQALEKDLADMIEEFQRLVELTGSYNDRIVALDFNKAKRKDLELLQEELVKCQKYADNLITAWHNGELNGATFLPSVDNNGNISWTNNKGLSNPATKNIIGPKGDKGDNAIYMQGVSAKQLALGLPPTVTNTGTATHPFLEFGIPIDIEAIDPKNWGLGYYTKAKTDLNAIKETGWYWVDADKSPVGYAAVLEHVQGLTSAFAKQMLYCVQGSYNTYTRVLANNSWTPWTVGDGQNTTISGAICNTAGASTEGYYPSVKVLGKTIETGTGEKSPDNPYVLSPSVPTKVVSCGKNLINISEVNSNAYFNVIFSNNINKINKLPRGVELFQKYEVVQTGGTVEDATGNRITFIYDDNTETISNKERPFTLLNKTIAKIYVYGASSATSQTIKNFIVTFGNNATPYEPCTAQEYTLPTLSLNSWDSYNCVSGELVVGSKEVVLNGSENWGVNHTNAECVGFYSGTSSKKIGLDNVTSDKFSFEDNDLIESVRGSSSDRFADIVVISIKKTRLIGYQESWSETQKTNAFKTWLQSNNVKVVYQLATPTITKLASQDIIQNINVYNDACDTQVTYNTHQASAIGMKRLQDTKLNKSDVVNNLTSTSTTAALSAAQGKWLQDNKVAYGDVKNNLTSTDTDKPLSAAQGKWLQDNKVAYGDVKNNLTSTDTDKPLSAAQGKKLQDEKAPIASPTFTGGVSVVGNIEITGAYCNFIAPNNYGYMGKTTDGTADYMMYMGTDDKIKVGYGTRGLDIQGGVVTIKGGTPYTTSNKPTPADIDAATTAAVTAAQARADEAFQFASDGKTRISTAITECGVSASSSDTFTTLATKIKQISVRGKVNSTTRIAQGYTWGNDHSISLGGGTLVSCTFNAYQYYEFREGIAYFVGGGSKTFGVGNHFIENVDRITFKIGSNNSVNGAGVVGITWISK